MEAEIREWAARWNNCVFRLGFQHVETTSSHHSIRLVLNDDEATCDVRIPRTYSDSSTLGRDEVVRAAHSRRQEFVCHDGNLDAWQAEVRSAIASKNPDKLAAVLDILRDAFRASGGAVSEDDDESEYQYDSENDSMGEEDDARDQWLEEHNLFERLSQKEAAMRGKAISDSLPASARRVQNIFHSSEAGKVLLEEFREVRRGGASQGILADAVDDDIYHWQVQLRDFPSSSEMAKGLRQLVDKTAFGVDFVTLEVQFARGLYPFSPPLITPVRPRLSGSVAWRLMCHPELRLEHWKPIRAGGMVETLSMVKDFLARHGEVDIARVSRAKSADYSELERIVLQLGRLAETLPRAASLETDLVEDDGGSKGGSSPDARSPKRPRVTKNVARDAGVSRRGFAKGTGYSDRSDEGWDPRKFRAAQLEKDRQLMHGIRRVIACLEPAIDEPAANDGTNPAVQPSPVEGGLSDKESNLLNDFVDSSDPVGIATQLRADAMEQEEAKRSLTEPVHVRREVAAGCYDTLANASLLPLLAVHLSNESVLDMEHHRQLNRALLRLVRAIGGIDQLAPLLLLPVDAQGSSNSVASRLQDRAQQAHIIQQAVAGLDDTGRDVPYSLTKDILATMRFVRERKRTLGLCDDKPPPDPVHVARRESTVPNSASSPAVASAGAGAGAAGGSGAAAAGEVEWSDEDEARYCEALGPLRYRAVPSFPSFSLGSASSRALRNRRRMRRIGSEHADLARALPVAGSSSAFVRCPESSLDTLRVMIVGPEGTPYSGGLFLFEFFLEENYPESPPKVKLLTTGGGQIRFNPNLYANGKVCLSLLGTWRGAEGEGWDANTSTLNQVILSIQSLILVEDPYFNEPGYQREINTPEGDRNSLRYNQHCRLNTIRYAMVDMLQHPPSGFEDVVPLHFRLRKNFILKQVERWCTKAEAGGRHGKISSAAESLRAELEKLE